MTRPAPVAARYISNANATALVGQSYRWCRDFALTRGVPVHRQGRKSFIDAAKFFDAIETRDVTPETIDEAEALRRRLGLVPVSPTALVLNSLGLELKR